MFILDLFSNGILVIIFGSIILSIVSFYLLTFFISGYRRDRIVMVTILGFSFLFFLTTAFFALENPINLALVDGGSTELQNELIMDRNSKVFLVTSENLYHFSYELEGNVIKDETSRYKAVLQNNDLVPGYYFADVEVTKRYLSFTGLKNYTYVVKTEVLILPTNWLTKCLKNSRTLGSFFFFYNDCHSILCKKRT